MKLADVPAYVKEKTGVDRSRQTVYNWAKEGVTVAGQKFKLETETKLGQLFTRSEWVDAFLARLK